MTIFDLQPSDQDHILLMNDLFATFLEHCSLGPDQVAVHVRNTCQFHVDTLHAAMCNNTDQPEDDGDGEKVQNQCTNVVLAGAG